MTVRIPTDVDRDDKLLANLTGRQLIILAVPGAALYLLWSTTRGLLTLPVFAALALPITAAAITLALGRRDGLSMDRWVLAAAAHLIRTRPVTRPRQQRRRTPTDTDPDPALPGLRRPARTATMSRPPVRAIHAHHTTTTDTRAAENLQSPDSGAQSSGVAAIVDLGPHGSALLAVVSTVNIALRTHEEQHSLVASFAALLNSLTSPIHLLIRAMPLDLTGHISQLQHAARTLAHPALAAAAADHAAHLAELGDTQQLLRRQCFLVLREPHPATSQPPTTPRHAHDEQPERGYGGPRRSRRNMVITTRLLRRLAEVGDLLAPAGLTVTPLDAAHATAILRADSALPATPNPPSIPVADRTDNPGPLHPGHHTGYRADPEDYTDHDHNTGPERYYAEGYPEQGYSDEVHPGTRRDYVTARDYTDSPDYASPDEPTDLAEQPSRGGAWLLGDHTGYLYAPGELEELERATPPAASRAQRRPLERRGVHDHARRNRGGQDHPQRADNDMAQQWGDDEATSGWYPPHPSAMSGWRR